MGGVERRDRECQRSEHGGDSTQGAGGGRRGFVGYNEGVRRRVWYIATALVALVALIALAVYRNPTRLAFERAAVDLPAAEAEARRIGLPLTAEDLRPKTPIMPSENAAPLIRSAGTDFENLIQGHPIWNQLSVRGVARLMPEKRSQLESLFAAAGPTLDVAIQASERPVCDFERPWDTKPIWEITFAELEYLRNLTSALRNRGLWLLQQGDVSGAARDFRAALALARFAGSDGDAFGATVQMNLETSGIVAIEQAASLRPRDTAFLDQLDALLAEVEFHPVRNQQLLGAEVVNSLLVVNYSPDKLASATFNPQGAGGLEGQLLALQHSTFLAPPLVPTTIRKDAYRARALRFWSRYIAGVTGADTSLRAKVLIDPTLKQLDSADEPTLRLLQHGSPITKDTHKTFFRRDAKIRTTRALLAVLKHRIQHGRYPTSLAGVTSNTDDPFSFSKLGYRVNGEEVRVYSVDRDEMSNGGRLLSERRWYLPRGGDIVSLYPYRSQLGD